MKTTFSGPVQSMNGFIDENGDPIGGTPEAPTADEIVTTTAINSAGGNITIASGTSVEAALQAIADAADPEA